MTKSDMHHAGATPDRLDDDLDLLSGLLGDEALDADAAPALAPRTPGAPVPMSFSQELLWMLDRATPGLTAYNLPIVRRLRGPLDAAALARALTLLVARHESLRTRFAEVDGVPRLIVDAPADVTVTTIDLAAVPAAEREAEAERVARDRARTPFDLAHEHLFRPALIRLADDDHVLLLESHHIVLDGWSMGILYRELEAAYAAYRACQEPVLPAVPVQFGDFTTWQREYLSGPRLERLLEFWRGQLGTATEPLALPTDRPRPTSPTFAGARQSIVLPPDETSRVRELAQRHDATLYMVLLAAYAAVLHRYTGRRDVLVGSGSAGRTTRETESIVGYLNNTLVQRADFDGDPTFAELVRRVRSGALGAYDHQEVPLEKLVLELRQGQERLSDAPLFEVVLTMQETMSSGLALAGLDVGSFGVDMAATKFDLTLLVSDTPAGLQLTAQYRSDLFEPETMRRFLGHVRQLLASSAADAAVRVSALPMLVEAERAQLDGWNATTANEGEPASLVALFERQAARVPDRAAVVASEGSAAATLTYAELDARANRLARHLQASGVAGGARVGLLLDRSGDAIVGLLGILKAGAAYVPMPIDAPAPRLRQQLVESGAKVVVTVEALADRVGDVTVVALDRDAQLLAAQSDGQLSSGATPESLAYVLYTSGSTGVPKGVAVTHANAVHYARAVSRVLADTPVTAAGDGLAALDGWHFGLASTLAADLGNTSLFPALLAGGTLHVLSKEVTTDPSRFAEYAVAHPLDALKLTPNHLAALTAGRTGGALAELLPSRWMVLGGEALRPETARTLLSAGKCRVLNHYGPTETTVGALTREVSAASLDAAAALGAQSVPVGSPLLNTHAYVVDARGGEQPVGVPGELWLGGAGVARGYLGRPELTDERFVELRGERVYRTGDRVRRLGDGTIEFLGRIDDQVKVRGFRVELGEVEAVLDQHPGVTRSVVVLRDDALVAFVAARSAGYAVSHADRASAESLRTWMADRLPEYMVPSAIVLLDALPLTANGKVDRQRLPAADIAKGAAEDRHVAPRTEMEAQLATIWQEVLKRDRIGATDDFLDLGGHSLLAIRVLGRISKTFGVRLALRTLFDAPTVEQLALAIEKERGAAATAAPAPGGMGGIVPGAYRIGKTAPAGGTGGGLGGAS